MKTEIVEAVQQILAHLYTLTDSGLPDNRINRIRRETIFFLYEGGEQNKWSFDRPHSAQARQLHRKAIEGGQQFNGRNYPVTFDHAIPLRTLRDGLREATNSTDKMCDFLHRHIQGVVILKEENSLLDQLGFRMAMPIDAEPDDLMARYRAADIAFEEGDLLALNRYNAS